jgi:UDP-N-acetylglucosamine 2-epimerase (non-hydrolysing)
VKEVAIVLGTRPEAIKLAPVYQRFRDAHPEVRPLLWFTGQHQEMLQQAMAVFGLTADRNFKIMTPGQSLTTVTTRVLSVLEDEFGQHRPDLVMVQGDTTTAFAAALAAFYARIPVAHVEAGLRTHEMYSPYPEELNRQLVSRIASISFAPTEHSKRNLVAEGINPSTILVTGNTVIDALDTVLARVRSRGPQLPLDFPTLRQGAPVCLITGHRRENFGQGFQDLCAAIAELAALHSEAEFVYPVHLNPNVRKPVYEILKNIRNVYLIEPLEYEPFVWLMDTCTVILSDSGGIQEEAAHLGKPVFVMRALTERPEGIEAGTSFLVGTSRERIVTSVTAALTRQHCRPGVAGDRMLGARSVQNPFGDGHAAERICRRCVEFLSASEGATVASARAGRM